MNSLDYYFKTDLQKKLKNLSNFGKRKEEIITILKKEKRTA